MLTGLSLPQLGLVWRPCSGPLLGSALALLASNGGAARGGLVLALFGLGVAPLLVAAPRDHSGHPDFDFPPPSTAIKA